MYICNCMGVTDREIRGAADLGCETVADLTRDLGVGSCCGKCVPEASALLRTCCKNVNVTVRYAAGGAD